ncbi:DUF2970 domain-containing protein [Neisseriaceae bacterium TC5R-5]|nr:DUF2970 domain-containing protein [Neisseriaceae bacterium TC5R-5]
MTVWQGIIAILAAFFGVRKKVAARKDAKVSPIQLIITALFLAAVLIGGLLLLVSWVTA